VTVPPVPSAPLVSPLLTAPGAVANPEGAADFGVAWHHGDPFAEQRAAVRSAVVVDRSNRGVLAVPGPDRLSWLHSLTSQDFEHLADGAATEALILDVQGRVEHHAQAAHLDGTVWLDTEPGKAAALLAYLESMRFWTKVEPRDATAELAVLTLVGPDTPRILTDLGVAGSGVTALAGGGFSRPTGWPGQHATDLVVPRADLADWWRRITAAGARPAGSWAFEALRVEALRPRLGVDTDEKTIPHEVGWIGSAVHLAKGCYRGQETVAKVHNVGRPPRRMVLLLLDGTPEVQPETGDPVLAGDKVVGRVGSVALHHELGPIALALLKRTAPVDGELLAGVDDRQVLATVDPDSVPAEGVAPGREAIRNLGR
jgi:folate-binding protein YgfZ